MKRPIGTGRRWADGWTIAAVLLLAGPLMAAQAQAMNRPGMGGPAAAPAAAGQADEFAGLWRQARAALSLDATRAARLEAVLQAASGRLAANWATLQEQLKRENAAAGEAQAALHKRIGLTDAERDLIVEGAATDLRDFLTPAQVDLVLAAAFHGVSRAHSEQAMPMTMGMGTGMKMAAMNGQEELMMRLAAAALPLNEGFRAGSLEAILQDRGAR